MWRWRAPFTLKLQDQENAYIFLAEISRSIVGRRPNEFFSNFPRDELSHKGNGTDFDSYSRNNNNINVFEYRCFCSSCHEKHILLEYGNSVSTWQKYRWCDLIIFIWWKSHHRCVYTKFQHYIAKVDISRMNNSNGSWTPLEVKID